MSEKRDSRGNREGRSAYPEISCALVRGDRSRACRGFTLAELLIAIGILGVGLTMSAALFPAGLEANKNSVNDLTGTLLCQNGLAVASVTLTRTVRQDGWVEDCTTRLHAADHPSGDMGIMLFARTVDFVNAPEHANDYELFAVSYRKHPDGGAVTVKGTIGTIGADGKVTFQAAYTPYVQAGSVVLLRNPGLGAASRVVKLDGDVDTVEPPLPLVPSGTTRMFVLYQEGVPTSPTMAVMSVRTSLRDN